MLCSSIRVVSESSTTMIATGGTSSGSWVQRRAPDRLRSGPRLEHRGGGSEQIGVRQRESLFYFFGRSDR